MAEEEKELVQSLWFFGLRLDLYLGICVFYFFQKLTFPQTHSTIEKSYSAALFSFSQMNSVSV